MDIREGIILLAIDGEPHTEAAVRWSLDLATTLDVEVVALHVKDPWLKQFFNDIYAQGREEYLAHVEDCLTLKEKNAVAGFETAAGEIDVRWSVKVREGDPVEEMKSEIRTGGYSLLVLGRKQQKGLAAWRSRDLAGKLITALDDIPVLVVPSLSTKEG